MTQNGFLGTIGWIKSNLMSNPDLQDKGYSNETFYPGAENIPESRPSAKPFKLEPVGAVIDDNGIATFNQRSNGNNETGLKVLNFPDLKGKGFTWTVRFMTGTQAQMNNSSFKGWALIHWTPNSMTPNSSNTKDCLNIAKSTQGYRLFVRMPASDLGSYNTSYGPVSVGDNSVAVYLPSGFITPQTWYDVILDYNIENPNKMTYIIKNLATGERQEKLMNFHANYTVDMNRNGGDITYYIGGSSPQNTNIFYQAIDTVNTTMRIK